MAVAVSSPELEEEISSNGNVVSIDLECYGSRVVVRIKLFGTVPIEVLEAIVRGVLRNLRSYRLVDVALEVPDFLDLVMVFDRVSNSDK